jgi:polysaccharide biosynthesis transport protein
MAGSAYPSVFGSRSRGAAAHLILRLRRRWPTFAVGFVVVIGLVWVALQILPARYSATSAILVQSGQPSLGQTNPLLTGATARIGDPADIDSQIQMIRSPRLLRQILATPAIAGTLAAACEQEQAGRQAALEAIYRRLTHVGLEAAAEAAAGAFGADALRPASEVCAETVADKERMVEAIARRLTVTANGRSRVLTVSFRSSTPEAAVAVANGLGDVYLADNSAAKVQAGRQTIAWLGEEAERLGETLKEKEALIEAHRRQHDLVRGQTALVSAERLSSLTSQLAQAQAQHADALSRLGEVREARERGEKLATIPAVLSSQTVKSFKEQEAAVLRRLSELEDKYGAKHPLVQQAVAERRQIARHIEAEGREIVAGLERETNAAKARESSILRLLQTVKSEAAAANDAEMGLQGLLRDVSVGRELYLGLSRRMRELEAETRAQTPDARLVNYAERPVEPSFPKPLLFMAAGVFLATSVGVALAYLRDRADNSVRALSDLTTDTPMPILGFIPAERWLHRSPDTFIARIGQEPSPLREAVRALYAQLGLMTKRHIGSVLVTSSEAAEGKTTLAASLAMFAASVGSRVLLIEADLRRPTFGRLMDVAVNAPGLEAYLRGEAAVADVIDTLAAPRWPRLHVIPAGRSAPDSTELLSNGRIEALLAEVKPAYDLVIIDSPPCQQLMDARILGCLVDGILYSVRWGASRPDAVRGGLRSLTELGGHALGVVLGMVQVRQYARYEHTAVPAMRPYLEAARGANH